jgi:hypothetical protein
LLVGVINKQTVPITARTKHIFAGVKISAISSPATLWQPLAGLGGGDNPDRRQGSPEYAIYQYLPDRHSSNDRVEK